MRNKIVILDGLEPESLGIELSVEGLYTQRWGVEGAGHMTREYSYIESVVPFRLLINGKEITLPPRLRDAIEENIKESFFE